MSEKSLTNQFLNIRKKLRIHSLEFQWHDNEMIIGETLHSNEMIYAKSQVNIEKVLRRKNVRRERKRL
jgi:hypothetical protein